MFTVTGEDKHQVEERRLTLDFVFLLRLGLSCILWSYSDARERSEHNTEHRSGPGLTGTLNRT